MRFDILFVYESLLFQLDGFAAHDAGNVCCTMKLVELLTRIFPQYQWHFSRAEDADFVSGFMNRRPIPILPPRGLKKLVTGSTLLQWH